jgi:isopenicillin N synthase-like dioxygenase
MLEVGTGPELKEGLYIGEEISKDHPYHLEKKLNSGPNQWPPTVPEKEEFQKTTMEYYHAVFVNFLRSPHRWRCRYNAIPALPSPAAGY